MIFLYDLGIWLYTWIVRIASFKNKKAKAWLMGRNNLLAKIAAEVNPDIRYTWFHFASLGEFEQGRPVMEAFKKKQPETHLLITFFSPSGYEIRKKYSLADHVFYLPIDTAAHAEAFINLINPTMAVFTKYEYWYHYFNELQKKSIPLYMISAIFRPNQSFFKWYGILQRQMLRAVTHFFVQNEESKRLLESISINNVSIAGDTRFDRVFENASQPKIFDSVKAFVSSDKILVAGSTWPEDEKLLAQLMGNYPTWKLIIAPHEVNQARIHSLEQLFNKNVLYSTVGPNGPKSNPRVLIIDTIGMLSSLYQYGQVAYVGGGFGSGIHNTLEAAAFGVPIIFGPKYDKFQEAKDMINIEAAFSIKNLTGLNTAFKELQNPIFLNSSSTAAKNYVSSHIGTTDTIVNFILKQ